MSETLHDRAMERLSEFDDVLDLMPDGGKKRLVADALYDYCRICVQYDDICDAVCEKGTTVKNPSGSLARNPDLMTQHQLLNEKNALLPKLLKALPDCDAKDALASFAGI